MRVFAALPLPRPALLAVETVIAELRRREARLRYVKSAGIHLTLHFFGELPDEAVQDIRETMKDPDLVRFVIPASFGALGQFPEKGSPRVVWLAVEKGAEELVRYNTLFQSKISRLGYREDPRGFHPHLTLARNPGARVDGDWMRKLALPGVEFAFQELVLFRSILKPGGAEYEPLSRVSFTEGGK